MTEDKIDDFMREFQEIRKQVKELSEYMKLRDANSLNEEVMNSKQVMELLQISEPTLIKRETEGKFPFKRFGKEKRYLRSEIMKYLKSA